MNGALSMGYLVMAGFADYLQLIGFAEQTFNKAGKVVVTLECAALYDVMYLGVLLRKPSAAHTALKLVLLEFIWPLVWAFSRIAALVVNGVAGEGTPQSRADEAPVTSF